MLTKANKAMKKELVWEHLEDHALRNVSLQEASDGEVVREQDQGEEQQD